MKYDPVTCVRFRDGFTSSTFLKSHLLTSSSSGKLCRWDLETGNLLSEFDSARRTKFCAPYAPADSGDYTQLAVQGHDDIALFELQALKSHSVARVATESFARLSVFDAGPSRWPLIIAPSGLNGIKILDPRMDNGTSLKPAGLPTATAVDVPPLEISHPLKTQVGMIHACQPFYSFGAFCIVSTYESGSIAVHDVRNPSTPCLPVHVIDSIEPIPALSIWRNVLLVGDTVGDLRMFHASQDAGVTLLKRASVAPGASKPPGISCLGVRRDGALAVAGCWDRCLRVLETRSLELKLLLDHHCSSIVDVSFGSHSDRFCSASADGSASLWDCFAG